jgi:DNA-directed RNA polymerase specialized sigma24 family protein
MDPVGKGPWDDASLVERAKSGEPSAVGELFARHRSRLRRMVEMRLDHRLNARVDPSDVIQEAYLDAAARRRLRARSKVSCVSVAAVDCR